MGVDHVHRFSLYFWCGVSLVFLLVSGDVWEWSSALKGMLQIVLKIILQVVPTDQGYGTIRVMYVVFVSFFPAGREHSRE